MSLTLSLIQITEIDEIILFEKEKLKETFLEEVDQELYSWNARWRKESLEYYVPIGWSFLVREESTFLGYFIAQPLLFLDAQTQSLWVEHLQYKTFEARDVLCEMVYKLGREKHFQKVYFPNEFHIKNAISNYKPEPWDPQSFQVKTTK